MNKMYRDRDAIHHRRRVRLSHWQVLLFCFLTSVHPNSKAIFKRIAIQFLSRYVGTRGHCFITMQVIREYVLPPISFAVDALVSYVDPSSRNPRLLEKPSYIVIETLSVLSGIQYSIVTTTYSCKFNGNCENYYDKLYIWANLQGLNASMNTLGWFSGDSWTV
jgi:hypothetical protein